MNAPAMTPAPGNLPELFVIRHGETEWNRSGLWQGDLDSPLTERGRVQARDVGGLLARLGVSATTHAYYTSPQGRARRTARIAFGAEVPLIEDARLREISVGLWTGVDRAHILATSGLSESAHFLDFYAAAPGGEPLESVLARAAAFLADLTRPSVIVTHGITSRLLRTAAMGWGMDRVRDLPGGQGVVHHIACRQHAELLP